MSCMATKNWTSLYTTCTIFHTTKFLHDLFTINQHHRRIHSQYITIYEDINPTIVLHTKNIYIHSHQHNNMYNLQPFKIAN